MPSRLTFRAFARSLTLVPLAVLLHIGAASASDSGGAQEQARQLLLGITSSPPHTAPRGTRITGDAQQHARQLLLGSTIPTPHQPLFYVYRATAKRGQGDAQAFAREVLLGRDDRPAAGR